MQSKPMPTNNTVPILITCTICGSSKATKLTAGGKPRLPRSWKEWQGSIYCSTCWHSKFMQRTVTLQVASPVSYTDAEHKDGVATNWEEFGISLNRCGAEATALSNWAISTLFSKDIVRSHRHEKMLPMPKIYLYGLATHGDYADWDFWQGATQSAQCLFRSIELKYRALRFKVKFTQQIALPSYKYPQPYPVHNAAWSARYSQQGVDEHIMANCPLVSLPLDGKRWLIRLKSHPSWARQLTAFKQIVNGQAVGGELAIYRRDKFVFIKIAAWLPKATAAPDRSGTITVTTGNGLLLTAQVANSDPWLLHGEHMKQRIAEHRQWLNAMSDDSKYEKRWPKDQFGQMKKKLQEKCHKNFNRVKNFCHEASAQLVNYAVRKKVLELVYDDSNQVFAEEFPWAMLKKHIQDKCEAASIIFKEPPKPEA